MISKAFPGLYTAESLFDFDIRTLEILTQEAQIQLLKEQQRELMLMRLSNEEQHDAFNAYTNRLQSQLDLLSGFKKEEEYIYERQDLKRALDKVQPKRKKKK